MEHTVKHVNCPACEEAGRQNKVFFFRIRYADANAIGAIEEREGTFSALNMSHMLEMMNKIILVDAIGTSPDHPLGTILEVMVREQ